MYLPIGENMYIQQIAKKKSVAVYIGDPEKRMQDDRVIYVFDEPFSLAQLLAILKAFVSGKIKRPGSKFMLTEEYGETPPFLAYSVQKEDKEIYLSLKADIYEDTEEAKLDRIEAQTLIEILQRMI